MYELVADIERYPEFLPWCLGLRVVKTTRDGEGVPTKIADMIVAYKMFREKFRSEARLDQEKTRIDVHYVDGPFHHLRNRWQFNDQEGGGSRVDFEIEFEFRNFVLQTTAQSVFEKAFLRMSEAFVARADDVYGAVKVG